MWCTVFQLFYVLKEYLVTNIWLVRSACCWDLNQAMQVRKCQMLLKGSVIYSLILKERIAFKSEEMCFMIVLVPEGEITF